LCDLRRERVTEILDVHQLAGLEPSIIIGDPLIVPTANPDALGLLGSAGV
jgi:hypothetical protein